MEHISGTTTIPGATSNTTVLRTYVGTDGIEIEDKKGRETIDEIIDIINDVSGDSQNPKSISDLNAQVEKLYDPEYNSQTSTLNFS